MGEQSLWALERPRPLQHNRVKWPVSAPSEPHNGRKRTNAVACPCPGRVGQPAPRDIVLEVLAVIGTMVGLAAVFSL
jgi:hypothetical protein